MPSFGNLAAHPPDICLNIRIPLESFPLISCDSFFQCAYVASLYTFILSFFFFYATSFIETFFFSWKGFPFRIIPI